MAESESDSGQERTEEATPKRQEEAKKKGQVPRSRELNTMVLMLTAATALWWFGPRLIHGLLAVMHDQLTVSRQAAFDPQVMVLQVRAALVNTLYTLVPIFSMLVVAALGAPLLMGGWSVSGEALSFKWEKLDPVKGLGKVFAWRGLVELLKALAKFVVIGSVALLFLKYSVGSLLGLGYEPLGQALGHTGHLIIVAFLMLASALVLIAAVDVPFQLWQHGRDLRMTRQEVRDEQKETDGNPEAKSQMRSAQRELAQRRMMAEVPKADVVVTNPQHYAVALRYDQARMRAPVVVAKGADLVAARIRSIAEHYEVPLVAAPPLARALYRTTEIEAEIPAGLYLAVAQVLAYVFQLKRARSGGRSGDNIEMPDLPIPDDMRYD